MDVRGRCRFTIECLNLGFQWDVENLKRAKSTLDLEILKKAHVIGMTTTGKYDDGAPSLTIGGSAYTHERPKTVPYTTAKAPALLGLKLD